MRQRRISWFLCGRRDGLAALLLQLGDQHREILLFLALGGTPGAVAAAMAPVMGPALALFVLSAVLSGAATLVVVGITEFI